VDGYDPPTQAAANGDTRAPLESITEASGWLGNRTSFAIAAYSAYVGNKLDASWFPSQETAQSWEGFVTP
jgi:hypothetical protein